jgi:hypothetical protein
VVEANEIQVQVQPQVNSILIVLALVLRGLGFESAAITFFFYCRDRRLFNRNSTNIIFEVGGRHTAFSMKNKNDWVHNLNLKYNK